MASYTRAISGNAGLGRLGLCTFGLQIAEIPIWPDFGRLGGLTLALTSHLPSPIPANPSLPAWPSSAHRPRLRAGCDSTQSLKLET